MHSPVGFVAVSVKSTLCARLGLLIWNPCAIPRQDGPSPVSDLFAAVKIWPLVADCLLGAHNPAWSLGTVTRPSLIFPVVQPTRWHCQVHPPASRPVVARASDHLRTAGIALSTHWSVPWRQRRRRAISTVTTGCRCPFFGSWPHRPRSGTCLDRAGVSSIAGSVVIVNLRVPELALRRRCAEH